MQLYQLLFGKSKKKMKVIMVDAKHKCEAYMKARMATKNSESGKGWYKIEVAPADAKVYRKKGATIQGQSKSNHGPIAFKQKGGKSGYISKEYGFQENT